MDAGKNQIGGRCSGDGDLRREPCQSVGNVRFAGIPNPNLVAAVRFQGRAEVPAINPMGGPRCAVLGFFVDDNAASRWCEWRTVEVVVAMELGPSG